MIGDDPTPRKPPPAPNGKLPSASLQPRERIRMRYRNWRGEVAIRRIEVIGVPTWSASQYHPEPQWLVAGLDLDLDEVRLWAVKDMEPIHDG